MFETHFTRDIEHNTLIMERDFAANLKRVWQAWTDSEALDKWWAPKPWQAVTKSFDFKNGGQWLYSMRGPNEEQHWAKMIYESIKYLDNFSAQDVFTDEQGNVDLNMPQMHWFAQFQPVDDTTRVRVITTFPDSESLTKILEMGVEKGTAMSHQNLDELLAKGEA